MNIKKLLSRIRQILLNLGNYKYLRFQEPGQNGIVILVHESKRLGASLLALNLANEFCAQGQRVYIIARNFGELNDDYARIVPTQIALTRYKARRILKKLSEHGYNRILVNTVACGNCTKIAKEEGYKVVSLIHELAYVIHYLQLERDTKEMLAYSDKVIFSTNIAKIDVLTYLRYQKEDNILVRPQGTYFKKPDNRVIIDEVNSLSQKFPNLRNTKIVIGVGNTTERKGFDIFLSVARKMTDYMFVWAGRRERYFDEAVKINDGIPNNFIYLGCLDSNALAGLYSMANIMLLCSRKDTLPSTVFEALLFGVPVVASTTSGGVVDIINDTNGILTDDCDIDEFVNAIKIASEIDLKDNLNIETITEDNGFSSYAKYLIDLF